MSPEGVRAPQARSKACWLVAVAACYLVLMAVSFPGHLTADAVLMLREGRLHVRETWNPAAMSWMLGAFDRLLPGAGLYLLAMGGVLFAAIGALARLVPKVSPAAFVVLLAACTTPQLLIYQGDIWKDVAFANVAVAGFVVLGLAARAAGRSRFALAGLAAVLFALAALLRQNGLVVAAPGAVVVAMLLGGPRRALAAGGWLIAVAAAMTILAIIAQPQGAGARDTASQQGVALLQRWDLAGVAKLRPDVVLPRIDALPDGRGQAFRAVAQEAYAPDRIDRMAQATNPLDYYRKIKAPMVSADWLDVVTRHPGAYLAVRWEVFRWVLATPEIDRCAAIWVGLDGPPQALADLKLVQRNDARDTWLFRYAYRLRGTPLFSHLLFAAVSIGVAAALALRRRREDIAILGMIAGSLLFAATFFVLSIACDYRYLYVVDLTAIVSAIYLAMDWRLRPAIRR